MRPINVHDAKTNFSKLLDRVAQGEEITLAKAGKPVAKLVPIPPPVSARAPGSARGQVKVGAGFDDPLPEDIQNRFG